MLICENWNPDSSCQQFFTFKMTSKSNGVKAPLTIKPSLPPYQKPDAIEENC
jgi:hypothetical protein